MDKVVHKEADFFDKINKRTRFNDTEVKIIISEIEEGVFKDLDLTDTKIEMEINSILKPCPVCSREIKRFEKMYNATTKVHSTSEISIKDFEKAYPHYK